MCGERRPRRYVFVGGNRCSTAWHRIRRSLLV